MPHIHCERCAKQATHRVLGVTECDACGTEHDYVTLSPAHEARLEWLYALGFDKGPRGCSQCEAISINGMPCHETGCPNEPTPELDYNDEEG